MTDLTQIEEFFTNVFGGDATDGDVSVKRSDGSTIVQRDLDAIHEFISTGTDGEAWVSMQTRSEEDGNLYEQAAVASHPKHIARMADMPPASVKLRHEDGDLYLIWLLAETVDLRKGALADELSREAPLPGIGGWSIEAVHADRTYELKDLESVMVPPPPCAGEVVRHGDVDPAILERSIEIAISSKGQQTMPGQWRNKPFTIAQIIDTLSHHKIGEKDGNCILQGPVVDGKRQANAIPRLELLIIDLDTGQSIDEMRAKLQEKGLFAVIYTTHSHGKPLTEIKRDEIVKHLDGSTNFDVADVCNYLITKKRYQPELLEGAELLSTEHTGEGVKVRIKHKPMPKFRVLMLLKEPFVIQDRAALQQDAIKEWKERYAGASKMLDAYFDRSCVDPSRLFFTPRHPKNAKEWRVEIIPGKPLDIDECERITAEEVRRAALDPMERAAEDIRGNKGKDYRTEQLKWFFAKYGDRFDVDTFLMDIDGDGDRGPRPSGVGRVHRCPNDDAHSDAGNEEDKGFFCVNGTESERGGAVAHCSHDSCSGLDRMDFVDLICERVGIKDATELKKWVPKTVEDVAEEKAEEESTTAAPTAEKNGAYQNFGEAKRAVLNMEPDNTDQASFVAVNIGMTVKVTAAEMEHLKKVWIKRAGMGAKVFAEEVKRGKRMFEEMQEAEFVLDDDAKEQLAAVNRQYACVSINGTFNIIEEPLKPGMMPIVWKKAAWEDWMREHTISVETATGELKKMPLGAHWLKWDGHRKYDRIVFKPSNDHSANEYNIWKGLAVEGKKGDWSRLRTHIYDNVCGGIPHYYAFFMLWMAHLVQFPGEKLGSAIVLHGLRGTGKSKVFDWLRKVFGENALKVNDSDQIMNSFNRHQLGLLLMVCEEAIWAGDARAAGKLKDMITSTEMLLTSKGVDSVRAENLMRLVMISNEEWVVPASLGDERRFFVLHCGDAQRGNTVYFQAIDEQMENGGLEAMVYELQNYKPDPTMFPEGWNSLRKPPQTTWLTDQGRESMPIWEKFFYQSIDDGEIDLIVRPDGVDTIPLHEDEENLIPAKMLRWFWAAFIKSHPGGAYKFGDNKMFENLVQDWLLASPVIEQHRIFNGNMKGTGERIRCYRCPPLKAIRASITERKKLPFTAIKLDVEENVA